MISKIVILALSLSLALACQDYTYDDWMASSVAYDNACNGSPCVIDQNCEKLECKDPPTMDEINKWAEDQVAGKKYKLDMGVCGGGLGIGAIIGIIVAVLVAGGVAFFFYNKKKQNLQTQLG